MKTNYSGILLAWLAATLLLTACGGGGGSAPAAPTPSPTGHLTLTMPLVVGQNTTFDFLTPSSTNSYWTPNTPYPTVGQFFATWASIINGPPDVALPYLSVDRGTSPNSYEYLTFRIDSSSANGHTAYLSSTNSLNGNLFIDTCLLSGANTVLSVPSCSNFGITIDWIAKTITFVQTPLVSVVGGNITTATSAGIVTGTLKFTTL